MSRERNTYAKAVFVSEAAKYLYKLRWAIVTCLLYVYLLRLTSLNLQHFITESNKTEQGRQMTIQNLQLDQNAQAVNVLNACSNVVRSGKGI